MVDFAMFLKTLAAFVFVIALMLLCAWLLKKSGFNGASLQGGKRRLKVLEHLSIDHRHRLVLVRRDDKEHLLLLGPNNETVVESNIPAADDLTQLTVKEQGNA